MNNKQRFVIFWASICNAFAILCTIFPLVKDRGYRSADLRDVLPFLAERAHPGNSLLLYVICYSALLLSTGLYLLAAVSLSRSKRFSHSFGEITLIAGLFSLAALVGIRICSTITQMCWIHIAHLIALGVLITTVRIKKVTPRLSRLLGTYEAARVLFCALCAIWLCYFCINHPLNYVRGAVLTGILEYFWRLSGVIAAALLIGHLYSFVPLSLKTRYYLALPILLALDLYVICSLALFTFRNDTAYFDASTIAAPMHDILLGKDIGVDIISTYGFLNIYLYALFCKVFGFIDYYQGLAYLVSIFFALGFSAIYLLLRYHTKNMVLSLLGILFIVNTTFNYTHVPVHWMPQVGFFRFGAFVPIVVTFYFIDSFRGKRILEWIAATVMAFSLLYLPETGLYGIASIVAIVAFRALCLRDWFYARFFGKICAVLLAFVALFEIYILTKHGQRMNWLDLMYFQVLYSKFGFAMHNFDGLGLWSLVSLVYLFAFYALVERAILRESGSHDTAWMYLCGMGPLMLLYFVGKQGLTDLVRVQIPAIVLVVVGANYALRKFPCKPLVALTVYGLAAFAISSSWYANDRFNMRDHWLLTKPKHYTTEPPWQERFFGQRENYPKFLQDVEAIRALVPADQGLAIMSRMDTLFYLVAERKSIFRNKFYPHFSLESEMEQNANLIHSSGTKYFFVEHTNFQIYENLVSEHTKNVLYYPINKFNLVKKLNFLDVYEVVR